MLSYYKHPLKYPSNIENYREQDFINFNLANLSYPISPFDMAKMEQHLKININLFSFNDRDGSNLYALYFGPHVFKETVNLIYWNNHYAWIKSIERLLNCITNFHGKTYWCNRCLNYYTSKRSYDAHDRECPNEKQKTKTIRFTLPISRSLKEST